MHVDEQLTVPTKSHSKKKTSQPKKQPKGTLQSTFSDICRLQFIHYTNIFVLFLLLVGASDFIDHISTIYIVC